MILDAHPPPSEPLGRRGYSTVIWPNGSAMCVGHQAPVELQLSLTLAWMRALTIAEQEEAA